MTYRVFSVLDAKTGVFMRPFFDQHLQQALRSWKEACNQAESPFCKYPTDFVLYEVGSFNDEQGLLVPLSVPVLISTALEQIERSPVQDSLPFGKFVKEQAVMASSVSKDPTASSIQ